MAGNGDALFRARWRIFVFLALFAVAGLVLAHAAPLVQKLPLRDQGVYLYMGERILEGKVPYRDVWDHKGPLVYYINAVGLYISDGSLWGVWFLDLLFIVLAAGLGYVVLDSVFGFAPATFATFSWLLSLSLVARGGNWVEDYALPLQFLAFYLFLHSGGKRLWPEFLVGVTWAMTFLLRPNIIGVQLALVIYIALSGVLSGRWRNSLVRILVIFLGFFVVLLVFLVYFGANHAVYEFLDAVFNYNMAYSTASISSRVRALGRGIELLGGIGVLSIAAWIIGCAYVLLPGRDDGRPALLCVALILLPLEFLLSMVSGKERWHYYIPILPALSVLLAFFAFELQKRLGGQSIALGGRRLWVSAVWIAAFFVAINLLPLRKIASTTVEAVQRADDLVPAVKYVQSHTAEDEYLLMWGAETSISFLTNRPSPSRFVYQYPLLTLGYQREEIILEFLHDIDARRPLIIDTSSTNPGIPPISDAERRAWVSGREHLGLSPDLDVLFEYLSLNYAMVDHIEPIGWTVYKYEEALSE